MNFIMIEIYAFIFQKRMPWVLLDMWDLWKVSTENRIGVWFLSEYGTMMRLYCFTQSPYMLPYFLTPKVFSMDFIRKMMPIEIECFLKYKKSTDIKYPWVVVPFTIKNKGAFPMVEGLLRELGFETKPTINYDPHQVISNRRNAQKRNPFKHEEVVGLAEAANWSNYLKEAPKIVVLDEDPSSRIG